ncbi:unnamed protein product [Oppiella nova]|uniref:Uncharacterized protein n=1 Tax=Oppiella nova TaxID=334625 RepID=A0A7R9MEG1_9ACAR|nr:unnamed protein product [Oppiella nova]CAG2175704.1 unnamed protein product [Oppiella nova]
MMKLILFSCTLFALSYSRVTKINSLEWTQYKLKHGKVYYDSYDDLKHYNRYNDVKQEITEHNRRYSEGKESYLMAINKYSDVDISQFKGYIYHKHNEDINYANSEDNELTRRKRRVNIRDFYRKTQDNANSQMSPKDLLNIFENYGFESYLSHEHHNKTIVDKTTGARAHESVDWRTKGLVGRVRDQGSCGSCWAHSAVGALEGQHAKATGKLVELSVQNLVDCGSDAGCAAGGWPFQAYKYIIRKGRGIDTEVSYPTINRDNYKCLFNRSTIGATTSAFAVLTPGDEEALKNAVTNIGPISVCLEIAAPFVYYGSGVFDYPDCDSAFETINHCMLAVGYGTDSKSGKDYWLVKNSFGTDWGDQGYIKMVRNKHNQCGISTMASYPVVTPV